MTTSDLASLVFIGDRPAQMAALVLDASVTYTSDRADPFMVQRLVESYVSDQGLARPAGSLTSRHVARRIILSTGLTWAPKYDGMAARQVNTLIQSGSAHPPRSLHPFTPRVYVLPVSSSHILGHALNIKLDQMCEASQMRSEFSVFLGGAHPFWSFAGDTTSPLSPTPVEILSLSEVLKILIKLDPK